VGEDVKDFVPKELTVARAPASPRRRLAPDERRRQILTGALRAFSTRRPDQISMEELARACDSSPALIYHYFGDRHGLTVAALGLAADELIARLDVAPDASALEQLSLGLAAYLDYLSEHPTSWAALLSASAAGDDEVAAVARRVDDEATRIALHALGFSGPAPTTMTLAVRGWLELVKDCCLRWLETGEPTRRVLNDFLAGTFVGCVQAAAGADPECQPALEALA
jgi:AcrR family transcriptional regulator